jgi:predicted nucleic acid-binding protein
MITFLDGLQSNPLIEVVFVDAALHQKAWTLLKQRPDKEWTLCDVVSFLLMQQRGLTEALATDHHFAQAGFRALLEKT